VRATVGAIGRDALDAFLALGEPITASQPKVVFIRQLASLFPIHGVLWMANLDGSEQEQLTPDGVQATFAGLISERKSGNLLFYYVSWDGETKRSLWQLDLATSERSLLLSYEGRDDRLGDASVTSDGRYVALSHIDGIDVLDVVSGERRRIVTSNWPACEHGAGGCFGYDFPSWSPDGSLLLLMKRFWEGGVPVVLDPFAEPPQVHVEASPGDPVPTVGEWSRDSAAFCGYGRYGAPSGLYLASAPDWQPRNLLPDYETSSIGPPPRTERSVGACDWLDSDRIAFIAYVDDYPAGSPSIPKRFLDIALFDLPSGGVSSVATTQPDKSYSFTSLFAVLGGRFVVAQYFAPGDGGDGFPPMRTDLIDASTGQYQSILSDSDWVVAVVEPWRPTP